MAFEKIVETRTSHTLPSGRTKVPWGALQRQRSPLMQEHQENNGEINYYWDLD